MQESAAHELWDESIVHQLATATVRQARDAGALAVLPQALVYRAGVHLLAGEFATAATLVEEANSIAAATDHLAPVRYHSLLLAAWRGIPADAIPIIEAAAADGNARGEGRALGLTGYATAVLYNGLGRYDEALVSAREACQYGDLGSLPDSEIKAALATLPEGFRTVVYFADVQGYTYAETAAMLNIPLGTVMSRVSRGRQRLRIALAHVARSRGNFAAVEQCIA